jgi:hypothetical protein
MGGFPKINIIPIRETEMKSTFNSLKSNGSSGYDKISRITLKLWETPISKPLSYISNKSASKNICLEHLKHVNVEPLHKKGDKSSMANYRPISLLTVFSNVFVTTMYHRLIHHLRVNYILAAKQTTEIVAYTLTDSTTKSLK